VDGTGNINHREFIFSKIAAVYFLYFARAFYISRCFQHTSWKSCSAPVCTRSTNYAKLEQARAQNRKLEAEAAIFAAIRRAYAGCTQGAVPHAKKAGSMVLVPARLVMKLRRESRASKPDHLPLVDRFRQSVPAAIIQISRQRCAKATDSKAILLLVSRRQRGRAGLATFAVSAAQASCARRTMRASLAHQLRQLGDIRRDPPCLVARSATRHLQIIQGRELSCGATCPLARTMRDG
jgi:hypothetical protein